MSQTDVDQTEERMRKEGGNKMELRLFRVAVSKGPFADYCDTPRRGEFAKESVFLGLKLD